MAGFARHDDRGLPIGYQLKPQFEISPRGLKDLLDDPVKRQSLLIVDVRLANEVDTAHVAPYLHIPLHEIESRVDEVVEAAESKQVVTLCHHGVRSLKASLFLRSSGVANALSMAGGIEAWSCAIDPKVPRYERDGSQINIVG